MKSVSAKKKFFLLIFLFVGNNIKVFDFTRNSFVRNFLLRHCRVINFELWIETVVPLTVMYSSISVAHLNKLCTAWKFHIPFLLSVRYPLEKVAGFRGEVGKNLFPLQHPCDSYFFAFDFRFPSFARFFPRVFFFFHRNPGEFLLLCLGIAHISYSMLELNSLPNVFWRIRKERSTFWAIRTELLPVSCVAIWLLLPRVVCREK